MKSRDSIKLRGYLIAECYGPGGRLRWRDEGPNLVVDEGINFIWANDMEAATLFVGLKDTGTPAVGWTLASGLTEINPYAGNRIAFVEDASAVDEGISNSLSPAIFTINAVDEVFGAFLTDVNTGTGGTLIAAKDFVGGSHNVFGGDKLNITYTITATSS
ncbi:MAG: hypothetical protein OEQ39_05710 [Gammaproteobacteria bacterium]|nr:hypothetical protein [Gammaproteobacteria bacterium]